MGKMKLKDIRRKQNVLGHMVVLMARSRMQKEQTAMTRDATRKASVPGVKKR